METTRQEAASAQAQAHCEHAVSKRSVLCMARKRLMQAEKAHPAPEGAQVCPAMTGAEAYFWVCVNYTIEGSMSIAAAD